ncbi:hypothetical protein G7046_g9307 [Stylonectria norvegica]|nr:hypothetical protein G7046_g9307 [Stylonectria norvegica]
MPAPSGDLVYATVRHPFRLSRPRALLPPRLRPQRSLANFPTSAASPERLLPPRYVLAFQLACAALADSSQGALVLAHSLRDAGTTKRLAVLVTLDSVSADSITQLKASMARSPLHLHTVYDDVFPVPRIRNDRPANLYLMDRADLHSAFTKINLWKLTQFSKIVYIDADVVAYRAPDELFAITHAFSAAPDIGWPDLFNSGVMVLTPNMGDYYAMMAMAQRGISFDGADQGLLNMHFGSNYNRLSFTYNVTPSAHYQYVPAYRHFQSSINMVHFIGSNKPWFSGRDAPHGSGPFDEMVGRWWAVYDRHYRVQESAPDKAPHVPEYIQYFTKGEFRPQVSNEQPTTGEQHRHQDHHDHHDPAPPTGNYSPPPPSSSSSHSHSYSSPQHDPHQFPPPPGHEQPGHHHHEHHHDQHHDHGTQATRDSATHPDPHVFVSQDSGAPAEARSEQQVSQHHEHEHRKEEHHESGPPPVEQKHEPPPITMHDWDAQRHPPPSDSKPEALNFPVTHYEMSQDSAPFVPPQRYPSPPRNMWYDVPKERPAHRAQPPPAIFPWEGHQPRPSRQFFGEPPPPEDISSGQPSGESFALGSSTTEAQSQPSTPATPTFKITPSDPWTAFTRVNAWDEVPEIERYVEGLTKHRRGKSLGSAGRSGGTQSPGGRFKGEKGGSRAPGGFKLTDFPTEVERPSLPVTPAPIRRPNFWDGGEPEHGHDDGPRQLPAAEGVPAQSDWVCVHGRRWGPADCICELTDMVLNHKDPMAQLQKLAKQQSNLLMEKFGGSEGDESRSSAGVSREIPSRPLPFGSEHARPPTYVAQATPGPGVVLSPQPVKGKPTRSILRSITGDTEEPSTSALESFAIAEPSYGGPGAAWERGEDYLAKDTPMPPTEDERDVLDT